MSKISVLSLVLAVALTGSLSAQPFLSCEASPSEVMPGGTVSLNIEASTAIDLFSGCALIAVHQGSPTGPVVYSPFICPSIFITVGPGAPWTSAGWQVNANTAPGDYYIEILGSEQVTQAVVSCFCPVRVVAPGSVLPTLTNTTGPVMNGSPVGLQISSPGTPNAMYVLAASLTTNVGVDLSPTQHLALDGDVLFDLSLQAPAALFSNFQGNLDGAGDASATMFVPPSPLLAGWPIAFQGAVFLTVPLPGVVDSFALTTPLSHIIH